jgi:hypothetical protein
MKNDEKVFEQMMELAEHPVVQDFNHHRQAIAGFLLPPSIKKLFEDHHHHCFDEPNPEFTKGWGTESPNWKWQKTHNESIGSTQSAVAAVFYHCENILRIEREVLSFHDIEILISLMSKSKSTIGGGNTEKLNFEYHAFIFAYRRTLDYLSRGVVTALIKEECKSYNKLPNSLKNHSKKPWVQQIIDMHSQYASQLKAFVHPNRGYSTRDRITHFQHVPAGCLNVTEQGIFFVGGGENLNINEQGIFVLGDPLRKVIDTYVFTLQDILTQCFSSMAAGMPKNAD